MLHERISSENKTKATGEAKEILDKTDHIK